MRLRKGQPNLCKLLVRMFALGRSGRPYRSSPLCSCWSECLIPAAKGAAGACKLQVRTSNVEPGQPNTQHSRHSKHSKEQATGEIGMLDDRQGWQQALAIQTEKTQKQTQDPKRKGKLKGGHADSARAVQSVVPFHFLHIGLVFFHGNASCQVLQNHCGSLDPQSEPKHLLRHELRNATRQCCQTLFTYVLCSSRLCGAHRQAAVVRYQHIAQPPSPRQIQTVRTLRSHIAML